MTWQCWIRPRYLILLALPEWTYLQLYVLCNLYYTFPGRNPKAKSVLRLPKEFDFAEFLADIDGDYSVYSILHNLMLLLLLLF